MIPPSKRNPLDQAIEKVQIDPTGHKLSVFSPKVVIPEISNSGALSSLNLNLDIRAKKGKRELQTLYKRAYLSRSTFHFNPESIDFHRGFHRPSISELKTIFKSGLDQKDQFKINLNSREGWKENKKLISSLGKSQPLIHVCPFGNENQAHFPTNYQPVQSQSSQLATSSSSSSTTTTSPPDYKQGFRSLPRAQRRLKNNEPGVQFDDLAILCSKAIVKTKGFRKPIYPSPYNAVKSFKFRAKKQIEEKLKFNNNWVWSFAKQLNHQCSFISQSTKQKAHNETNKIAVDYTVNNFLNYWKLRQLSKDKGEIIHNSDNETSIGSSKDLYDHVIRSFKGGRKSPLANPIPNRITQVKRAIHKSKNPKKRERKSRAKLSRNPQAYRRRIIKLMDKIRSWRTLKYQKIVNRFLKRGQSQSCLYEDEESVFSLDSIDFSEPYSNLSQIEKLGISSDPENDSNGLFSSVQELFQKQSRSQKAFRYYNLKFKFTMERIRRKVKNSFPKKLSSK